MSSDHESHFWDSLLAFAAGTLTGFVLGILFAPASGKETRKKLKEGAIKAGEITRESAEKLAVEAEKGIRIVKEKTSEGVEAIRDFIEKKKEELTKKET